MRVQAFRTVLAAAALGALGAQGQAKRPGAEKGGSGTYEILTEAQKLQAKDFAPKRKEPALRGAFSVGLVLVRFPDTKRFELEDVQMRLGRTGAMTVAQYYKDYSQGITWPELFVVGAESFPQCVYTAPEPLGYYCRHDFWSNPLGYPDDAAGRERAAKLKQAARAYAFKAYKRPAGAALKSDGTPHVVAYVYERSLVPRDELKALIRPRYPKGQMITYDRTREAWELYGPEIQWSDPLWPDSSVQIHNSGDGGTLCHELGHVLGAPDFYHATERHDGVGGTPCLPWAFGPTGPGYCRAIFQAFLPPGAYPMLTKDGAYALHPRRTNPAGDKVLGAFIPSAHPNYLFCVEYVKDEQEPLGKADASGLLVQVINVTLPGPFMGPPDLCYVYRPGDPWLHGEGDAGEALFGERSGRPRFDMQSDPPARLPNLLDSGIALEAIRENTDGTLSFTLKHTTPPMPAPVVRDSLLPKINLDEVTNALQNSVYAKATVTFRGEPLNTEYGFCWDTMQRPTCKPGKVFPLYHRDRYAGRILGLKPNTAYSFRAYIRSERGVSYSEQELRVKTPPPKPAPEEVPPLLEDGFSSNWAIDRFYGGQQNQSHFVGSCSLVSLLKLAAYYRAPLDADVRSPEFDYARIHTRPSLARPDFRMEEFNRAMHAAKGLAWKAKLTDQTFPKDFDRHVRKIFGLRPQASEPCVELLDEKSIPRLAPLIRAQLAESKPVAVVQESEQGLTPTNYALMLVLIDGCNKEGDFHIVFPSGRDRGFSAKTGWLPLTALFEKTNQVRVIFGLEPPSMR
jgi:M6 family metalloprotease-like protein